MEVPEVSVIVPNYNHVPYLRQRIESILKQSYRNFELIILDDNSTDGSSVVIESYRHHPRVSHIVYNTANSGSPFAQWEKGLKLATGKWVWIAESDDYATTNFLERLLEVAAQNENVGIAFCNSHWVDNTGREGVSLSLYQDSFFREGVDEIKHGLCNHCTIQNVSSAIIRREEALKAVEGLHKFKACGDWIFYTRLLHYCNISYTSSRLNYFRWYHQSVSSTGKDRLWATEGAQVLLNINFNKVKFSKREFSKLIRLWLIKCRALPIGDKTKVLYSVIKAVINFSSLRNQTGRS